MTIYNNSFFLLKNIKLRLNILDTLCEYDRRSPDFLLTLLFLLNFKNEIIKQAAIHHLEILNLSSITNSTLIKKFKNFYFVCVIFYCSYFYF